MQKHDCFLCKIEQCMYSSYFIHAIRPPAVIIVNKRATNSAISIKQIWKAIVNDSQDEIGVCYIESVSISQTMFVIV